MRGTLTLFNGQPARGIALTASDSTSGVTVGTLTDRNGQYTIRSVPPGSYVVFAEPLDGVVRPGNFKLGPENSDVVLDATFYDAKRLVPVAANSIVDVSFLMPARCLWGFCIWDH
jgi:hypothetical protein